MSVVDEDGRQYPELSVDLVGKSPAGEPLTAFLTLFYYGKGVFTWMAKDGHALWWSPEPRAVFLCRDLKVNRTLRKTLRRNTFRVTADTAFDRVVLGCRDQRSGREPGSWINDEWVAVMSSLHALGHAHSVEVWAGDLLVGGLFGVAVGQMFYGCSMFHRRPNASKVALVGLMRNLEEWGYPIVDCAIYNPHLKRMGARLISRKKFHQIVDALVKKPPRIGPWTEHFRSPCAGDGSRNSGRISS